MKRIPEVLDCWFESGSMPYGQEHWMKRAKSEELRAERKEIQKTVIILHGYTGRAEKNWLPWMKKELEKRGYHVETPNQPYPDDIALDEKVQFILDNYTFDENTLLI